MERTLVVPPKERKATLEEMNELIKKCPVREAVIGSNILAHPVPQNVTRTHIKLPK